MSGGEIERGKRIFLEALAVRGEARRAVLESRCGGDAALRSEVESLLRASETGASFLEGSAAADHLGSDERDQAPAWMVPGARIGRYTLVRTLGAGGMGVVFAARQDSPRRDVALKLLRPGHVGPSMLRRFMREAAVLGMLKHPGIAQVYEAGSEVICGAPVPYLAMELVEGVALGDWTRRGPSLGERVSVIAQVCEAVAHAHQRGVIHRDLKPGNVIVDAAGTARVLDFGIARLVEGDEPGMTVHTAAGVILGTLAYMSPEQVSGDPSRVDVRSDVYALGALMFDVLAGRPPIEVATLSVHEAVRRIADRDPARLGAVSRQFRGDLDTIAARALEKDPARRYQSASEMAEDLRRHLRHEPILARPASAAYTVRKFARRNRAVVAGAAAVFLALAGGLAATAVQARRARQAAETAHAINEFLQEMLRSVEPDRAGKDATVREVLDHASETLESRFADRPLVRAGLHSAMSSSYLALGHFERSEAHARAAVDIYRAQGLEQSVPALRASSELSSAMQEQGRYRETIEPLRAAIALAERAGLADGPEAQNLRTNLAFACEIEGMFDEAERLHRAVLNATRRLRGAADRGAILTASNFGLFLIDRGRMAEAEPVLAEAHRESVNRYGRDSDVTLTVLVNLSVCYSRQGKDAESEPLMREAVRVSELLLGPDHPDTVHHRVNLGVTLSALGRLEEAEQQVMPMVAVAKEKFGPRDSRTLHALGVAARVRLAQARLDEALALAEEQYRGFEAVFGPGNHTTGQSAYLVVKVLAAMGREDLLPEWRERAAAGAAPAHGDSQ